MEPNTASLVYWIQERWNIKKRRESGMQPPWTGDNIMATTRWCNVHREDDAVTRYIAEQWRGVWQRVGVSYVGTVVMLRMLNYIPTLKEIQKNTMFAPSGAVWGIAKQTCLERRARGEKVFTSAYTISTCGKSMDKIDYVFDWVLAKCRDEKRFISLLAQDSLNDVFHRLTEVDGLGSFLAAQVLADLKNTPGHPLAKAPDWWTFSAPGPGSLRGLSWYFFGRPVGATPTSYNRLLNICRSQVDPILQECHPDIPMISDQDFQNCLCEFSKYMKQLHGDTHVRNRYQAVAVAG